MANFQVKNNTANKIEVCGETIEGNATNTIAVPTLYQIPNSDQRLADLYNDGTVDIILPAYTAQKYSIEETDALNWLYNTFSRAFATTTTGELHVYADGTNGDDANDGFSVGTPKKTLQAVFDLVPDVVKHNVAVHLSGVFSEQGYANLDKHLLNQNVFLVVDGGDDLTVVADNGGSPWSADISSVSSIGLTTWGKAVDQYAGYWVEVTSGPAAGEVRLIQGHTATTITPSQDFSVDPGVGAGFRVVRPSTEIAASSTTSMISLGCFSSHGNFPKLFVQNLYLSGSKALLTDRSPGCNVTFAFVISDSSYSTSFYGLNSRGTNFTHVGCDPTTFAYKSRPGVSVRNAASKISVLNCYYVVMRGCYSTSFWAENCRLGATSIFLGFGSRVIECKLFCCTGSIESYAQPQIVNSSSYATTKLGGTGTGLYLTDSYLRIASCDISNCTGHAIEAERSIVKFLHTTVAVTGSGNSGAGVYAHSGSVVHIKDGSPPTLTGTVGDLSFDGTTEASTWASIDAGTPVSSMQEMSMAKEV